MEVTSYPGVLSTSCLLPPIYLGGVVLLPTAARRVTPGLLGALPVHALGALGIVVVEREVDLRQVLGGNSADAAHVPRRQLRECATGGSFLWKSELGALVLASPSGFSPLRPIYFMSFKIQPGSTRNSRLILLRSCCRLALLFCVFTHNQATIIGSILNRGSGSGAQGFDMKKQV